MTSERHRSKIRGWHSSPRRRGPNAITLPGLLVRTLVLIISAVVMLIPAYLLIVNVFKTQSAILRSPFSVPVGELTFNYLLQAIRSPNFNVVQAYGITALFVVLVNILALIVAGQASYVIARLSPRASLIVLLIFVAGTFIPSQALLIPALYVLRFFGLNGTIPGFVLFETAAILPVSIFLYTAYIRSIPRELDEAAALDGAGRLRTFWAVIFPTMRPIIATVLVLNSLSIWNDFANPQIILGPGSGLYTVTTGVYAAVGQYSTNYNVVFPNLLLAALPAVVFFFLMQKQIIGGLVAGATKG